MELLLKCGVKSYFLIVILLLVYYSVSTKPVSYQ